jgi:hypothetical protein
MANLAVANHRVVVMTNTVGLIIVEGPVCEASGRTESAMCADAIGGESPNWGSRIGETVFKWPPLSPPIDLRGLPEEVGFCGEVVQVALNPNARAEW